MSKLIKARSTLSERPSRNIEWQIEYAVISRRDLDNERVNGANLHPGACSSGSGRKHATSGVGMSQNQDSLSLSDCTRSLFSIFSCLEGFSAASGSFYYD
ncbi:hypothetical protein AO278_01085 [Pseudomonas syringae pv. syringae]|nr:hypothetical protein AO278_01085 [Pseudomonas syringae pv. syringae]